MQPLTDRENARTVNVRPGEGVACGVVAKRRTESSTPSGSRRRDDAFPGGAREHARLHVDGIHTLVRSADEVAVVGIAEDYAVVALPHGGVFVHGESKGGQTLRDFRLRGNEALGVRLNVGLGGDDAQSLAAREDALKLNVVAEVEIGEPHPAQVARWGVEAEGTLAGFAGEGGIPVAAAVAVVSDFVFHAALAAGNGGHVRGFQQAASFFRGLAERGELAGDSGFELGNWIP